MFFCSSAPPASPAACVKAGPEVHSSSSSSTSSIVILALPTVAAAGASNSPQARQLKLSATRATKNRFIQSPRLTVRGVLSATAPRLRQAPDARESAVCSWRGAIPRLGEEAAEGARGGGGVRWVSPL